MKENLANDKQVVFGVVDGKRFLTIQEAADFLKVSKTSLRRWSNTGRLSCYRVGIRSERRFEISDLLAFLSASNSPTSISDSDAAVGSKSESGPNTSTLPHHISTYYRSSDEQWELMEPHLLPHLVEKSRTVYVHDSSVEGILSRLTEKGLNTTKLQQQNVLIFVPSDQTYLLDGHFVPSRMLDFWQSMIGQAVMDGVTHLLLTGEMSWVLRGMPGSELLGIYERELDRFLNRFPSVTVVCQYALKEFSGEIIFDSLCAHPHLQLNDKIVSGLNG